METEIILINFNIEFENVSFSYGDKKVLENLSFSLEEKKNLCLSRAFRFRKVNYCKAFVRIL